MQLLQTLCIALLSLSLFACGGSLEGDTETSSTPDAADTADAKGTTGATSVIELSARLLDCPSGWNQDLTLCTDTSEISELDPGVVAVSLSQNGIALSSQIVTGSVSKGTLTPDSVLTNSDGIAFFSLIANNDEGAGTITVTTDAAEQETTSALNFDISGNLVTLSISSTSISDTSPATLTATVMNAGDPVAGEVVNFGSTLGTLSPLSGTALTDASGIATITLTAGETAGAGVASATLDNSAKATVGFETMGYQSGATFKNIRLSMDVSSITEATPATVTATVTDGNGAVVAGEVVEFSSSIGVVNPVSGTALTNAAGEATITLTAGDVAGAGSLQASLTSGELNSITFETAGDASVVSSKIVTLSPISSPITDATPAVVTVVVSDDNGPLAGQIVEFSSSLGVVNPASGTALTDALGKATITLTAGNVEGAGLLRASLSSGEFDSIGFETAGDAPLISGNAVSVSISSPSVSDTSPATLTATVTNNGVAVAGEVVNFGSTLGALSPLSGTALTDASGIATITLTAGETAGAGVASAMLDNSAKATVGFETAGDATDATLRNISVSMDQSSITEATPATVIATVTDGNGAVVAGEVVEFTSSIGVLNPVSGTALTNAAGEATITLTAGDVAGAGLLQASLTSGEFNSIGFETAGDATDATLRNISLSLDESSITEATPATVTAIITDGNGAVVAGEVVEFSSSIGVLNPVSGTALTNAAGEATITLTAGDVAGAGLLQASLTSGELNSIGFETAGDASAVASKVVTLSAISSPITDATPAVVTVTVSDDNGPLAGQIVEFSSSLGVVNPASGTALTDALGKATITLTAGNVEGAGLLSASLSSGEFDSIGFETAGDAPLISGNLVTLSISSASVFDAAPATLTATVTNAGAPVAGEVVNFGSTLGALSPLSGTALTDASGIATITLTAGETAGAGVASATLDNGAKAAVGFETAGDATDATLRNISVSLDESSITEVTPATVTATVTDGNGAVVAGEVVEFTSSIGVLNPVSGTALTNAAGEATITLTAGDVAGAGLLQASLTSGEVNSIGFETAGDAAAVASKVVTLSAISSPITDATPAVVTVTVSDGNGPLAGQIVEFSSSLGVVNPVSGTALTDADGEATITLTAGDMAGAGLLQASLTTGEFDSIGFETAGDAPLVSGNSVTLSISSTSVSDALPATLTATVTNAGAPVAGEVVNFGSTLGALSPLSGTALTDASGIATITLTAGETAGAGVASVTLDNGAKAAVGFETAGDATDATLRNISLSLDESSITEATPATVTATVTDGNGAVVAGEVVEFTSSIGVLNPVSGTALTNAAGEATITLTAGDVAGAGLLQASLTTGELDTIGFETAGDTQPVPGDIVSLAISSPSVSDASPATLTATVTNAGVPVAGEVVNFGSILGALSPLSGTALTNADGIATITLTAGSTTGAGVATVTLENTAKASVGFYTAGDRTNISGNIVSLSISDSSIDADNPATLTATVTNTGKPVSGEVVSFSSALGSFSPGSATALTDDDGKATIILSAGDTEGASIVTASLSNNAFDTIGFETAGDDVSETSLITLDLKLVTPETTDEIGIINSITPGQVIATVTGVNSPVIVSFTSDIAEIPIATALTDEDFEAVVDIYAGNTLGAGTITATLKDGETAELLLVVGATDLEMGSGTPFVEDVAELTLDTISAGGTTVVSVDIVDENGDLYTSPVDVAFTSNCVNADTATISSPVTSSNGTASSTYLARGCVGDDPITVSANAGGVNLTATASVMVEAASAGSIEFVSVSSENISLKGIGGGESSTIVFKVLDTNGLPVTNKVVQFALNTNAGGVSLGVDSATSDSDGLVQTVVNSGTVATPVRVFATLDENSNIATQSSLLVISTGIPDQDSFSLSASGLNLEAWEEDGVESTITVRLADSFNNPAPDGTAVSFTTEGGSIGSSCTTSNGACSVTWTSQSPRPENGRVTILAYAIGEESFPDFNGNGRFDAGDEVSTFKIGTDVEGDAYDLPEAFIDYNEDNLYNPPLIADAANTGYLVADDPNGTWDADGTGENEVFYDFVATNGAGDGTEFVYDGADGRYNGSLCNTTDIDGNDIGAHAGCSEQKSIHVREDIVIVMSGSDAYFTPVLTADGHDTIDDPNDNVINITGENSGGATVYIEDLHGQPMPAGTVVDFSTTAGSIEGTSSFTWPKENANLGRYFSVVVKGDEEASTGTLFVDVTTPNGTTTTYSGITINISAP